MSETPDHPRLPQEELDRLGLEYPTHTAIDGTRWTCLYATSEGLDVERLARALAVVGWLGADAKQQAEAIAREYAALHGWLPDERWNLDAYEDE